MLAALRLRSSLAWGDFIQDMKNLPGARQIVAEHLPFMIVAELSGEIAGFATILPDDKSERAILEDLFVAPLLWRRGIGTCLLEAAEHAASEFEAAAVQVVANARALAFYESAGYRIFRMVETELGPAPQLLKKLRMD